MVVRLKYEKNDPVKFISHLDTIRVFERAMRRASLPVAFTKGFTPRPKFSFASALSVGITSSCELMDVEFNETISVDEIVTRLNSTLPNGFKVVKAGVPDENIQLSMINYAIYAIKLVYEDISKEDLENAIKDLLDREEIIIEKKSKGKVKKKNIAQNIDYMNIRELLKDGAMIELGVIGQGGNAPIVAIILELQKIIKMNLKIKFINREDLFIKKVCEIIYPL